MFQSYSLFEFLREYPLYQSKVDKLLSIVPNGIKANLIIDSATKKAYFQVFYMEDSTLFFLDKDANIHFWERDYGLCFPISLTEMVNDYFHFLDDEKNG